MRYSSYQINEDGVLVYTGIGSSLKGFIYEYEVYAIGLYGLIHGSMLAEELGFVYIQVLKAGKSTYRAFQKN